MVEEEEEDLQGAAGEVFLVVRLSDCDLGQEQATEEEEEEAEVGLAAWVLLCQVLMRLLSLLCHGQGEIPML